MRITLINILTGLCAALVIAGAGMLVGVWAVPQWDAYRAETQFSQMQASSSSSSSTPEGEAQLEDAHEYNSALAGSSSSSSAAYHDQLTLLDAQAISWLEIPSIKVKRPVYHYDNEEVLMAGLGHIEGTSLPVGGASTHTCITGHSGMPGSRMFDDLDKMEIGDVFVFWTLGDPYAYKVYDIEVVEPSDSSSLYIQPGRDLATLITCTPYGINSHRLLVHGERTDYVPEEMESVDYHPTSDRLWVLGAGIAAAAAGVAALLYSILGGAGTLRLASVANAAGQVMWRRGASAAAGVLTESGSEAGVAATEIGTARFDLKSFHRAKIDLNGVEYSAKWYRSGQDLVVDIGDKVVDDVVPTLNGGAADVQLSGQIRFTKVGDEYVADIMVDGLGGQVVCDKL